MCRHSLSLTEDAVAVAPANKDVHRPDPRPINTTCSVEIGPPEPGYCCWIEPGGRNGLRVAQGLVHGGPQTAPDPAIERQHEAALRPLEQCRVEAAQADTPEHSLA